MTPTVVFLWCEACAYTGHYTDAFYRGQRLDRVLDSLHFRSYSVGFYYSFLAYVFSDLQYSPPLTLVRIYTPFIYGSTYDPHRSKTHFFCGPLQGKGRGAGDQGMPRRS